VIETTSTLAREHLGEKVQILLPIEKQLGAVSLRTDFLYQRGRIFAAVATQG
jgi:hypothetical protein